MVGGGGGIEGEAVYSSVVAAVEVFGCLAPKGRVRLGADEGKSQSNPKLCRYWVVSLLNAK